MERLNRRKTSIHGVSIYSIRFRVFSRGMERTYEAPSNEAPHMYDPRISPGMPGDVPASFSAYGDRLSQERARRFNLISCMVAAICIILFQQEQPLDFPCLKQPGV